MSLRQRIVLTLVGIAALLAAPAAYGLLALRDLQTIARTLNARDVPATDALGDVRTGVETAAEAQRRYVALARLSDLTVGSPADTAALRARVDSAATVVGAGFRELRAQGYGPATVAAERLWSGIRDTLAVERGLVQAGATAPVDTLRGRVAEAFERMDAALDPIARAIDAATGQEVERAQAVARSSASTTLFALAAALLLTLVIGAWLTRTILRPVSELRRGMATVAEGDFEPEVHIPTERQDELGDLARSFDTMTAQLRELDRLKAEFVSVASHEIKTPLSVIRGYVTLLADGIYGEVNDKQKKTLEAVSTQTDRLTRLVHRLLDVSRFEAGGARLELREIRLRPFLEELTADFHVLALQNGIEFPVLIGDDLPDTLVGDEDRLNEVLGNLLSNAFKFTPREGSIRMEAVRRDGGVEVEVEDTGVGIPPEKLPRIFEKFYQVENDAQPRSVGSGLGLAIAREIVEAHGGTISADSRVGRGTRFTVFLPGQPPAARSA